MVYTLAMKYIAFLRGVNIGGHQVKMAELKKVLESMKLKDVATLIASGNVSFEAPELDEAKLADKMEAALEKKFGFAIPVMVRTKGEIQDIVASDPFKDIKMNDDVRRYVTFLKRPHASKLKIPYIAGKNEFRIIKLAKREIYSVLEIVDAKTVDLMGMIEKEFGKEVTTRNWNTVVKMGK